MSVGLICASLVFCWGFSFSFRFFGTRGAGSRKNWEFLKLDCVFLTVAVLFLTCRGCFLVVVVVTGLQGAA